MAANPAKIKGTGSGSTSPQNAKLNQEAADQVQAKAKQETETNLKILESEFSGPEFKNLSEFFESLAKLLPVTTKLTGHFLGDSELETCSKIAPNFLIACKPDRENRKLVREELLPHVFNAKPAKIDESCDKLANQGVSPTEIAKMLLIKADYREGYWSRESKQFFCFRHWRSVSPLQAAYMCGDKFIGRQLLAYIIKNLNSHENERLRIEIREQLLEVLNGKVQIIVENGNAAAPVPAAAAAAAVVPPSASANTGIQFVAVEYLGSIKELIKDYNTFITQYPLLSSKNEWTSIKKLWNQVGACHKRLPHYIKQEFFSGLPFDPLPSFEIEPNRAECQCWGQGLLDLDKLGSGIFSGLCKGWLTDGRTSCVDMMTAAAINPSSGHAMAQVDYMAIDHLCTLLDADLRNTIDCLKTPEATISFFSDKKI